MSLYQQMMQTRTNNFSGIANMIKGNPSGILNMIMNNPKFQKFRAENYGKTPQQIANEHGIDLNSIMSELNLQI